MITLKSTNDDGVCKEITFSDNREAADMLRQMFGSDALATEKQHTRDRTNAALRNAYRAKETDPSVFFRHGDNGNG